MYRLVVPIAHSTIKYPRSMLKANGIPRGQQFSSKFTHIYDPHTYELYFCKLFRCSRRLSLLRYLFYKLPTMKCMENIKDNVNLFSKSYTMPFIISSYL